MAHGGSRNGSGRKAGSPTTKTRLIAEKAVEGGVSPLEFMLQVMRDESAERSERLDMAKAAAPYVHPRLSSVEAKVEAEVRARIGRAERIIIDPQDTDAEGLPAAAEAGEI